MINGYDSLIILGSRQVSPVERPFSESIRKGVPALANHKSEIKRAKQNENRKLRNRSTKTRVKNAIKTVRNTAGGGTTEDIGRELNQAKSVIARAAQKGVIHPRNAARKMSRLSKLVNRSLAD
jgi:small subunit ribosomal protein S20